MSVMRQMLPGALERVNKELWVLFSLFAIALLLNHLIAAQRMVLSFYVLPTIASAYFYGRRHGTLTAFASVLLVVGLLIFRNSTPTATGLQVGVAFSQWLEVAVWGGSLIITGYLMGTLYESKNAQINELRETYQGVLMILRHFISKDTYTENHCYRVSVYATRIAAQMSLSPDRIEDVRAAALLHDIGKLDISRDLLYKAAKLTRDEYESVQTARPARHRHARTGRRRAASGDPDHPRPSRQVRWVRLQPDQRREHSARVANHRRGRRLRRAHERPTVPQGHVAVRSARRHHQRR